jgi:hypothetical protein
MFLKRRLAALATVIAALAVGPLVASATAATIPATGPVVTSGGCPNPNPAWGSGPYSTISVFSLTYASGVWFGQ